MVRWSDNFWHPNSAGNLYTYSYFSLLFKVLWFPTPQQYYHHIFKLLKKGVHRYFLFDDIVQSKSSQEIAICKAAFQDFENFKNKYFY